MNAPTITLIVFALATLAAGLLFSGWAALAVGCGGLAVIAIWSLCWVSGKAAQREEDKYGIRRS